MAIKRLPKKDFHPDPKIDELFADPISILREKVARPIGEDDDDEEEEEGKAKLLSEAESVGEEG